MVGVAAVAAVVSYELTYSRTVLSCRTRQEGALFIRDHLPGPGRKAALPLVCAYDVFERTWSPPMPFLFQRRYGNEDRPIGRSYIRECMVATSQAAQINAVGETLEWRPHDFRRILRHRRPAIRAAAAHRR